MQIRDGTVAGTSWEKGLDGALVIINISTPTACVVTIIYHYYMIRQGKEGVDTNGSTHPLASRRGSNIAKARGRRLSQLGQPEGDLESSSDEDVAVPLPSAPRRISDTGALNAAGRTPRDGQGPTTVSGRQVSVRQASERQASERQASARHGSNPLTGSPTGSVKASGGSHRGSGIAPAPAANSFMSPTDAATTTAAIFVKPAETLDVTDLETGHFVTDDGYVSMPARCDRNCHRNLDA